MSETCPKLLAYCAGVIDSDGTIGVKKSTYGLRVLGTSSQAVYSERIAVKQVEKEAVSLLKKCFGGCLTTERPQTKARRSLFVWAVTDINAAKCARALLPFLKIKRSQAKNLLVLRRVKEKSKRARVAKGRGHVGAARRPAKISSEMEKCYLDAKWLNRVGTNN